MPANKPPKLSTPEICPVCGEDVPPKSLACPDCGADHRSGWREDAGLYDGAGLPDGDFDYDEFVRQEFGSSIKPAGIKPIWWVTAVVLLVVFVLITFRLRFLFPF